MTSVLGIYGYISGMATAAILQPLDNIKMSLILPPQRLKLTNNFIVNVYLASKYIFNEGGIKQFYHGLISNVLKTGTSSAVYFFIIRKIQSHFQKNQIAVNFFASALGRIVSSFVSNPFSVLETRYQLSGQSKWKGSLISSTIRVFENEGILGFYKGVLANCYKQGSFAGLYYALYVLGKDYGFNSFVSGMTSGIFSTVITHPFEIVRASIQGDFSNKASKKKIRQELRYLYENGDLLKGVAPRILKKPLASTLSFLIFQYLEKKSQTY